MLDLTNLPGPSEEKKKRETILEVTDSEIVRKKGLVARRVLRWLFHGARALRRSPI